MDNGEVAESSNDGVKSTVKQLIAEITPKQPKSDKERTSQVREAQSSQPSPFAHKHTQCS